MAVSLIESGGGNEPEEPTATTCKIFTDEC